MKLNITTPSITIQITNDQGEQVYKYKATDLQVQLDTAALINGVGVLAKLVETVKEQLNQSAS